jgi:hypothetical protein
MPTTIKWRAISAIVLAAALAALFWLAPDLEPDRFAKTPQGTMAVFGVLFAVFWLYLVIQGLPIAYGRIGSANVHTMDSVVSGIPALVALFGIFISLVKLWQLSSFDMVIAVMTLFVVVYDLLVLGGAASQINRLTPETKIVQ